MNGLMLFEKESFGKVRAIMRDGEPWFVANDVAVALGYVDPKQAVRDHCKYAELLKGVLSTPLTDSPRGIFVIPEADVYALIFRSNLPKAEEFRRWVYEEVLPSIRKTGSYAVQGTQGTSALPDFSNPAEAARAWANEYEQKQLAIRQRDEALRTKAWISTRSQATAMATASAATRENNKLKNELGRGKDYKQVSAIPWLLDMFRESGGMYSQVGRKLADLSRQMGIDFISVEDTRYGTVKAYHVSVIEAFRLKLLQDKNMLGKYRV